MSDPVVRSIRTKRASPSLASHAPKDRITMQKNVSAELNDTAETRNVSERTMASSDRRAIRRCFR